MFTIALVNQKGGVGKSTTAVNLSAGLARLGQRVLLIDLDPQAHSTVSMGLQPKKLTHSVYSLLAGTARMEQVIHKVSDGLSIIPANIDLAGGEAELASQPNPKFILKNAMSKLGDSEYDYAIVDSPPQLGFLNVNNLAWVREVFIPLTCEFYALHGLSLLLDTVERLKVRVNPALQISGVIACQYNPRRSLTKDVLADLEHHFPGKVMKTKIRINVRLAESPSHGMSIFDYAPESNGAVDYMNLAKELLARAMPAAIAQEDVTFPQAASETVVSPAEPVVGETVVAMEPAAAPPPDEVAADAVQAPDAPQAEAPAPQPEVARPEPAAAPMADEIVAEITQASAPPPEAAPDHEPEGAALKPAVGTLADEVVAEVIQSSDARQSQAAGSESAPVLAVSESGVAESAPEVPVMAQEAPVEHAPASHDPYSEAEAAPMPAAEQTSAKSEFVSPLPPTPITELKSAALPSPSRPPMAGRYAMAGLKPIVVARPAGTPPPPAPEKKKGLFVNRLFNRFLAKKD